MDQRTHRDELNQRSVLAGLALIPVGALALLADLGVAGAVMIGGGFALGLAPIFAGVVDWIRALEPAGESSWVPLPTFIGGFMLSAGSLGAGQPTAALVIGWLALLWLYIRVWVV